MDTITTAIGGALLAKALPEEQRGPSGVWVVTLASAFPDVDVFADLFTNNPFGDLTQHRAFTHSVVGVAVLAPLLALVFWRFSKDKNFRRLLMLCLLGLGWHIFTDLATSWGTQVFYPINRERVVWDLIFIIDFAFTALLLVPQSVAWVYSQPRDALRRGGLAWMALAAFTALVIRLVSPVFGTSFSWRLFAVLGGTLAVLFLLPALGSWGLRHDRAAFCRIGVAALAVYLGVCAASHFRALQLVRRMATERELAVISLGALPQPLSPFRWSGLAQTPQGVYQCWVSVLDPERREFLFFPTAENRFVARARELPEVRTYLWFARFPVARYRADGERRIVEYADLRFRSSPDESPRFGFRVVFDGRGEVLSRGFVER